MLSSIQSVTSEEVGLFGPSVGRQFSWQKKARLRVNVWTNQDIGRSMDDPFITVPTSPSVAAATKPPNNWAVEVLIYKGFKEEENQPCNSESTLRCHR